MVKYILCCAADELKRRASALTLMDDFNKPFDVLQGLLSVPSIAVTFTLLPSWNPPAQNGRLFQAQSFLGSFFAVSGMTDAASFVKSRVMAEYFSNATSRSRRDVEASMNSLRITSAQLYKGLTNIARSLLKKKSRSAMLTWIGTALDTNKNRSQMQSSPLVVAADGFFINLTWTLLNLCEPFIDPSVGKTWDHLDVAYILTTTRTDFSQATKLIFDEEEDKKAREEAMQSDETRTEFHFICECFFITLKALHLGIVQCMNHMISLDRNLHHLSQEIEAREANLR